MEFVKVDTKSVAPYNVNFVTVQLSERSTVRDVKERILKKLKPKQLDPEIYDLAIVIESGFDEPVESVMVLSDERPFLPLKKYANGRVHYFCLSCKDGGQKIKIYTGDVFQGTNDFQHWSYDYDASSQNTDSSGSVNTDFSDELKKMLSEFNQRQFTWMSDTIDV